ncbi:phasin family protein [Methylobacterium sp. P31]
MGNDNLPTASKLAARAAAEGGVARARETYERFAETGEMVLNAFEASMAQSFEGWRAVMGSSREMAHQLTDSNVAGAREVCGHWEAAGAQLYNAFEDNAVHAMAAMRKIAHRLLVASDTNVRATLHFAERLAKAADIRVAAALNIAFLQEQSRRLADQIIDLQQTTGRLAREAVARTKSP